MTLGTETEGGPTLEGTVSRLGAETRVTGHVLVPDSTGTSTQFVEYSLYTVVLLSFGFYIGVFMEGL